MYMYPEIWCIYTIIFAPSDTTVAQKVIAATLVKVIYMSDADTWV